nr:MAG TPA: hypothetical protein [Caudoviricetes sp.]
MWIEQFSQYQIEKPYIKSKKSGLNPLKKGL